MVSRAGRSTVWSVSQQRTDWTFRLGLLSLLVPILGPFVWASASRALQN